MGGESSDQLEYLQPMKRSLNGLGSDWKCYACENFLFQTCEPERTDVYGTEPDFQTCEPERTDVYGTEPDLNP